MKNLKVRIYYDCVNTIDIPLSHVKKFNFNNKLAFKLKISGKENSNNVFDTLINSEIESIGIMYYDISLISQRVGKDSNIIRRITKKGNLIIIGERDKSISTEYGNLKVPFAKLAIPRKNEEISEYNARFLKEFGFEFYDFDDEKMVDYYPDADPTDSFSIDIANCDVKYLRAAACSNMKLNMLRKE